MCDLDLSFEGTALQRRIDKLHDELRRAGLVFRPYVWLSTDWFTPEGSTGFAVPFYLAHRRLVRLEHSQMFEAEGSTHDWCMKLLRHEAAHAIDNAYRLHARSDWRRTFGRYSAPYRSAYQVRPTSKHYVQHLGGWYAQSHPAEDWAESFAVWLRRCRAGRRSTKAGRRCRSCRTSTRMVRDVGDLPPFVKSRDRVESLPSLRITLREHYRRKKASTASPNRGGFDRELRLVFDEPRRPARTCAPPRSSAANASPARQGVGPDRPVPLRRRPGARRDAAALPRTEPVPRAAARPGQARRRRPDDDGDARAGARPEAEVPPMRLDEEVARAGRDARRAGPPADAEKLPADETWDYQMELEVVRRCARLGHEVRVLGVGDELRPVRDATAEWKPHVVFNILTDFHDVVTYEAHFVSYLELLKQPYTGCNPRGITLAGDKALSKQILAWHRIPVPGVRGVPAAHEEGAAAAPHAVPGDRQVGRQPRQRRHRPGLRRARRQGTDRTRRVPASHAADRRGRRAVPRRPRVHRQRARQRTARDVPDLGAVVRQTARGQRAIATSRVKWDERYQKRVGLRTGRARDLPAELEDASTRSPSAPTVRCTCPATRASTCASTRGAVHVIEANVNNDLSPGEDFPESAQSVGVDYPQLLQRIVNIGLSYKPAWKVD
jgi:hypothetical protein